MTIDLDESGNATVRHFFIINSIGVESIELNVFGNQDIRAYDMLGQIEFSENSGTITIVPKEPRNSYSFTIEYRTPLLTSKQGDDWYFGILFEPLNEIGNMNVELVLPPNSRIISISPEAIISQNQGRLMAEWYFPKLEEGSRQELELNYRFGLAPVAPDYSIFLLTAALIIVAILSYFAFRRFAVKKKKKEEHKDYEKILKLLNENERKVIETLLKESSLTQKKIQLRTALPKSTLSRTLKRLELRGLVKTSIVGITNIIELGEEFRK